MTLNNKNAEKPVFILDFQPVPCYNERTKRTFKNLYMEEFTMIKNELIRNMNNAVNFGNIRVEFNYSNVNKNKISHRNVIPTEVHENYFIGIDQLAQDYRRFRYDNMNDVAFVE